MAERWFGYLADQTTRLGARKSVQALEKDIRVWIAAWNEDPKPFGWEKSSDRIIGSLAK